MKNPLLFAQSVLAGLQVLNAGTALEGVGLPHSYTVLVAALIGAVQLATATYQHGQVSQGATPPVPAAEPAPVAPVNSTPTTPPVTAPPSVNPLVESSPGAHPASLPQVNATGSAG